MIDFGNGRDTEPPCDWEKPTPAGDMDVVTLAQLEVSLRLAIRHEVAMGLHELARQARHRQWRLILVAIGIVVAQGIASTILLFLVRR